MKRFAVVLSLSCVFLLLPVLSGYPAHAAGHHNRFDGRIFLSRAEVEEDASLQLSRHIATTPLGKTATMPDNSNYVRVENNVTISYGFAFRIIVPGDETRFDCGSQGAALGCNALAHGDHIIAYAHLGGQVGNVDGPSPIVRTDLIYRRSYVACGDVTCEVWTRLSQ